MRGSGNGFESGVATFVCPEVVSDRPVATGSAGTVAIWSLCVSIGDLVTVVLIFEKESDQIGSRRRKGRAGRRTRRCGRRAPASRASRPVVAPAGPVGRPTDPAGA